MQGVTAGEDDEVFVSPSNSEATSPEKTGREAPVPVEVTTPVARGARDSVSNTVPTTGSQASQQNKTPNPFDAFDTGNLRRSARRIPKRSALAKSSKKWRRSWLRG